MHFKDLFVALPLSTDLRSAISLAGNRKQSHKILEKFPQDLSHTINLVCRWSEFHGDLQ